MKLIYGDGKLQTQQGTTADGTRCITITAHEQSRPINSTPEKWDKTVDESKIDCILAFKNIESARVLQDELCELIAKWSKEQSQVV